jgi:hypothetical protein
MTPRRLALVAVLLAAAPALAQRNPRMDWHESEAGRFKVRLPGKPKAEAKELALGTGGQSVTITTERADGPRDTVFAVTYADYPESYRQVPAKAILDGVRDGLKGTDGKVTEDKVVFLGDSADKLPGREFRVVAGSRTIRARVFLKGTRLYQVMATGVGDRLPTKLVDDFFDSFELTK